MIVVTTDIADCAHNICSNSDHGHGI